MRKRKKMTVRLEFETRRPKKHFFVVFFKGLLNFRADALQSELNKVSLSNFVKFQLQTMSFKIGPAFEKTTKLSI